jgi:hypothetical protein
LLVGLLSDFYQVFLGQEKTLHNLSIMKGFYILVLAAGLEPATP